MNSTGKLGNKNEKVQIRDGGADREGRSEAWRSEKKPKAIPE